EKFLGLQNFRSLKMAKFGGPALDARPDKRNHSHELSVNVALNHLGGDGCRAQAELLADVRFDFGAQVRAGSHRAGNLPDGHNFARASEAVQGTAEFIVHQRHFEAEGGWLGMNTVAAPDHGSQFM